MDADPKSRRRMMLRMVVGVVAVCLLIVFGLPLVSMIWRSWQPFVPKPVAPISISQTATFLDGGSIGVELLDGTGTKLWMRLNPREPEGPDQEPNLLRASVMKDDLVERRRVLPHSEDEATCCEWLALAIGERRQHRVIDSDGHDWKLELSETMLRRINQRDP